jgi:hypothetical protein
MCLFCVCVVLCLGRGLATSWSLVQGVLPSVKLSRNGNKRPGPTGAVEPVKIIIIKKVSYARYDVPRFVGRGHAKETGNRNATATSENCYQPELNTALPFPQYALLHSVTCVQLRLITILGSCGCVAVASFFGVPSAVELRIYSSSDIVTVTRSDKKFS